MSEERQPQQKSMTEEAFSAWFEMLYTRYADDVLRVSYFIWATGAKRKTYVMTPF